jgi:hypothetical protein
MNIDRTVSTAPERDNHQGGRIRRQRTRPIGTLRRLAFNSIVHRLAAYRDLRQRVIGWGRHAPT